MDSLIQAFGIDARLITIQVLNFVVLAGLLTYFLYKPILRLVAEREEKIKQGLEDADQAKRALEGAEVEKKNILTAAHVAAEEVGKRAEAHATLKGAEIVGAANDTAADKLKQAEARARVIEAEALKKSEAEVAKMAVLAAEEILKKS